MVHENLKPLIEGNELDINRLVGGYSRTIDKVVFLY